jgi:hypothetical protein
MKRSYNTCDDSSSAYSLNSQERYCSPIYKLYGVVRYFLKSFTYDTSTVAFVQDQRA